MSLPKNASTLRELMTRAVSLHREGRLSNAEQAYRAVLDLEPDHAEALHLLGLVLHRAGNTPAGLSSMDRALELDPGLAAAWSNRALCLRALGRPEEAAGSLERALALRPELTEAWLNLARVRSALGQLEEATRAAREAAKESADGKRMLAALLCEAGRWAEAAETLGQTLSPGSGDPRSWALLAQCHQEAGDPVAAERAWREGLARPQAPPGLAAGLGALLLREGRAADALPWLVRAAGEAPEDHRAWLALADSVAQVGDPGPALEPALAALLSREGIDHQRLDRAVRARLATLAAPLLADQPDPAALEAAAEALARQPLFLAALRRMQLQDPRWERALTRLAELALRRAALAPLPLALVEGLAIHAWNAEHVLLPSPETCQLADALRTLPDGPPESWPASTADRLAAAALIGPLDELAALAAPGWEQRPLAALVRAQLVEPAEERRLAATLDTLGEIRDQTSVAVGAMYEENPYPRLVGLHRRPPTPLGALLRATLRRPDLVVPFDGPLDILVAGCGTGQHALNTATRTAEARVLAVDLSRASLGRAARLAGSLGVKNLRFARADILGLGTLEARFHVIESVGVLHHLADPAAGLRVLRGLLVPGGLMQLGLYSERGRSEIVAARALIAERAFAPDARGIRAARRALQALPEEHPAHPVVWSPDFYSLSGCRDLLFHVCEHRFGPLDLARLLDPLNLELLGFQHARPEVGRLYRERFPEDPRAVDLSRWDKLEDEHPRLFSGMLVFWARCRLGA